MTSSEIIWLIPLALVYLIPTLYAAANRRRNTKAIAVVNVFLGWTFIGWVAAMAWAAVEDRK